jgi:hypothetical protein
VNSPAKPIIPTGEMRLRPEDPPGDSANAEVNFITGTLPGDGYDRVSAVCRPPVPGVGP